MLLARIAAGPFFPDRPPTNLPAHGPGFRPTPDPTAGHQVQVGESTLGEFRRTEGQITSQIAGAATGSTPRFKPRATRTCFSPRLTNPNSPGLRDHLSKGNIRFGASRRDSWKGMAAHRRDFRRTSDPRARLPTNLRPNIRPTGRTSDPTAGHQRQVGESKRAQQISAD